MPKKVLSLGIAMVIVLAAAPSIRAQFAVLHQFSGPTTDGSQPRGHLVLNKTTLYGTTFKGGTADKGTIYKINMDGTGYGLLHSFAGGTSDGAWANGSLLYCKKKLYGMTAFGGTNNMGIIYRINLDGTGYEILHVFAGGAADGAEPYGALIRKGGYLFGMTYNGGADGYGTIFRIKPDGTKFALLHTFVWPGDGEHPRGSLISSGGKIYGMTEHAGISDNSYGTVFMISPNGKTYKILHSFSITDGAFPHGGLVARGSTLYGMTTDGGDNFLGVIFKISKNGTGFALLHTFAGGAADGAAPFGSLIFDRKKICGLTVTGGASNRGTLFRMNGDGSGFEILHSFNIPDQGGLAPFGDLLRVASRKTGTRLYGAAEWGGAYNKGTAFFYRVD